MDRVYDTVDAVRETVGDAGEVVLRERPTMEHVLLVLFLVAGTYMYLGAEEFSDAAATFPRIMAGVTAVLAALLLVRNYLPGPIRALVAEPMQVLGDEGEDEPTESDAEAESTSSGGAYTYDIDDPRGPAVTGLLCVLYMALTFAIGMLIATPVFVAGYTLWARMWWPKAIALTLISLLTAYVFYWLISDDIAVGWYTGTEPWSPPPPGGLLDSLPLSIAAVAEWSVIVA